MTRTAQRARIDARAQREIMDAAWNNPSPPDSGQPTRAVEHARRHLASLSPERRAMLQSEWANARNEGETT